MTGPTRLDLCEQQISELTRTLEELFVLLPKMHSGLQPAFLRKTCERTLTELRQLKQGKSENLQTPENL